MPKTKKTSGKSTKQSKQKLSPAERSQIAKDRWAKMRKAKAAQEATTRIVDSILKTPPIVEQEAYAAVMEQVPQVINAMLVEDAKAGRDENGVPSIVGLGDGTVLPNGEFVPTNPPAAPLPFIHAAVGLSSKPEEAPTPLAPAKAPKPKRIPVPKEFSAALKTADQLLAKAIEEYEECQTRISYLEKAIPRLQRTVSALRNESNPDAPLPSPSPAFQLPTPRQESYNPLAAIQAAMAAPPVSRASGGAVQFSPDVLGALEGPEDDDPDRFITGPAASEKGWIGG